VNAAYFMFQCSIGYSHILLWHYSSLKYCYIVPTHWITLQIWVFGIHYSLTPSLKGHDKRLQLTSVDIHGCLNAIVYFVTMPRPSGNHVSVCLYVCLFVCLCDVFACYVVCCVWAWACMCVCVSVPMCMCMHARAHALCIVTS
jgi:hypothetical protein